MKSSTLVAFISFLLVGTSASAFKRDQNPANGTSTSIAMGTATATIEACAQVSASWSAGLAVAPSSTPTVSAQLAYDCLTSVALDQDAAVALVDSILPYVEWESDISYLVSPPSGYLMPAIDIRASLSALKTNITSGVYTTEHAFQTDLMMIFQNVHDGHFRFAPDLLSKVLLFRRPVGVVSVSLDGVEVPKVYVREEIENYVNFNLTTLPSAITAVNGEDVLTFMTSLAMLNFLQDPDAQYNNLFYSKAFDAGSYRYTGFFALAGRMGYFYPGPTTTLTFSNGSTALYENHAEIAANMSGITNGISVFNKFCTGPHLTALPNNPNQTYPTPTPPSLPPTATVPATGYPTPKIISSDGQASGYFLDGDDYSDVAVLSLLSFEPAWPVEFQSVIQTMITMARVAGKTKLVIDLSANGGGIILCGYDAFRMFFPNITQDGFSRFRQHEAFGYIAEGVSQYDSNFTTSVTENVAEAYFAWQSALNYRYDLNETDGLFLSLEDKFQPQTVNGDQFTQLMRWNLTEDTTTNSALWGIGETITGYGNRANFTQPFEAMNIVLLYDGYCASTCTLFSEFMRTQGNVKSIAMGGRPNTDSIQGVGGTKGANNFPFGYIRQLAIIANGTVNATRLAEFGDALNYSDLPVNRSTDSSLNVRDQILRANLEDGTPAQYLYEEADCRLFYEPDMITDVSNIWKRAADAAWGGRKCVAGGISNVTTVETREERLRKSEEMKLKARSEKVPPIQRRAINAAYVGKRSLHVGQKVPL